MDLHKLDMTNHIVQKQLEAHVTRYVVLLASRVLQPNIITVSRTLLFCILKLPALIFRFSMKVANGAVPLVLSL